MSSYCFNSSIGRFSAFDRFGFGGLALFRISTTLDLAKSIEHVLAKLTWLRPAVPKLWVATHWWVVGVISVGRESHSKFKLLHALLQII